MHTELWISYRFKQSSLCSSDIYTKSCDLWLISFSLNLWYEINLRKQRSNLLSVLAQFYFLTVLLLITEVTLMYTFAAICCWDLVTRTISLIKFCSNSVSVFKLTSDHLSFCITNRSGKGRKNQLFPQNTLKKLNSWNPWTTCLWKPSWSSSCASSVIYCLMLITDSQVTLVHKKPHLCIPVRLDYQPVFTLYD